MEQVIFNDAQEMLNLLHTDEDLYNMDTGEYIFRYNEEDSIASYHFSVEKAKKLAEVSVIDREYWGAQLGVGGYIYDDPAAEGYEKGGITNLSHCKDVYSIGRWFKTSDLELEWIN